MARTKKCWPRSLCRANLFLRHFIYRIDIFRDNTGRLDTLDAIGLDIRVDFVHHG